MLQGVENYLRYARRGKVKPAFIAELKPTIRSDELRSGDWPSAEAPSNMDLLHPTGELRLKPEEKTTVEQPKCTLLESFQRYLINAGQIIYAGSSFYNYVQTFTTPRAFKLAKIQIGLFNEEYGYKGQVIIRILTGFQVPKDHFMGRIYLSHAILENAKVLYETRLDCSKDETNLANNNAFRTLAVDKNVWIPGGNKRCAITVTLAGGEGEKGSGISSPLQLRTAGGSEYQDGRLFTVTHVFPVYEDFGADMMFRLIAYGFRDSGSAKFYLDLGGSVGGGLENELAITYRKPPGTSISFTGWESATGAFSGEETALGSVDDGDSFSLRYLKIQVDMGSPADRLDSPRLFCIRAQSMRKIRFCRAERHLFGHPSILAAPPEYSAEGRPLEGDSSIDDSRLVMTDPGDMVTDIFRNHGMINDQVKVYAGFEIKGFAENDFIPFRTLRVEDWEKDGAVFVIHCIDAQIQLKNAEYPIKVDPPGETEEVHFNLMRPGELVLALLECAQIRKSMIDIDSFTALDNYLVEGSDPWEFNLVLKSGDGIKEKISEIMIHVPGFLSLGKDGKWHAKWIDFGASPVASFTADQVRLQSTRHYPNIKESSNVIKLFYGGDGHKETDYQRAMIAGDSSSIEAQKELTIKVMTSEILPAERRDVAARIASRVLALTKSGIQTVTAEGPLEMAILELGDIVSVECDDYFRKGAAIPNPLLCQVTRTAIVSDLTGIDFRFQKILDNEETPPGVESVDPPSNFSVVDGGDGSATWSFDASPDEPTVKAYELLQRVNRLQDDWIIKKIIEADQSSSYQFVDEDFDDGTIYDFAVRAATAAGVKSTLVIAENIQITNNLPAAPTWALQLVIGGWEFYITADVAGAIKYYIYRWSGPGLGWERIGEIAAPAIRKRKSGFGGHYNHSIEKLYGQEYGRFKLASVNNWGEGPASAEQADWSLPYQGTRLAANMTPGLPSESGTYPILTLDQNDSGESKYSVELKIEAPADYEDQVARYELQRRDNGGGSYGEWEIVGVRIIDKYPAPHIIHWINQDVQLKPGVSYQWQVRARAQDGTASPWSASLTKAVAGHSTAPDQPTLSVTQHPLGLLIMISTPAEGGQPMGGHFSHFKIEGNKGGGWDDLVVSHHATIFYLHNLVNASMAESWQHRVTTYDASQNPSPVSAASAAKSPQKLSSSCFQTDCLEVSFCNFVVSGTGNIIGIINASTEGGGTLKIAAKHIAISGSTNFSAGYNPTEKVAEMGGNYDSAASGARVRIFPDADIGLLVTDGTNDVFKCLVGGTDVGDIILGSAAGQHVKWDKSASTLIVNALLAASGGIKTSTGDGRIELGKYGEALDALIAYSGGVARLKVFSGAVQSYDAGSVLRCQMSSGGLSGWGSAVIDFESLINTDAYFSVDGTKVVGNRGAAIANPTDAATTMARLIDVLDFLRDWEAIAT